MKNFLKIGLFLTLAFIIASCENPTNEKPTLIDTTLEAITIKTNPTKTTYQVNEEFDPTGLVITATYTETYSNASTKTTTKDVTYNNGNMTFSGTDFSTVGTKTITVTYSEKGTTKTATLQVTVNQDGTPESGEDNSKIDTTLESITIKTNPTKTTYQVNEEFDPTGLVITATYTETYSNASTKTTTKDVTYNNGNMTFSGTDFSTVGTKTITVTYSENGTTKTATLQVTVNQDEDIVDPNTFTYDDEVTIADNTYTAGTDVTIQIPATENEQPTTVNIAKLYEQYNTIAEQVGEEGSVSISYADPANTTIEGDFEVKSDEYKKIESFVNGITSSLENLTKYPNITMDFGGENINFYKTGIGDLLNKYYNTAEDKIKSMTFSGFNLEFDAVDYLTEKGGIAYDQNNQYTGNYYDLDVNAALLMGVSLKNVNVVGELQNDLKIVSSLTNTRFEFSNPNSKEFTFGTNVQGVGLIEFAGDAPSLTPIVNSGRLVLRNAPSKVSFQGGFSIDVSSISDENAIHTNVNHSTAGFTEVIYPTQETANTTQFTPSSTRVGDNLVEGNNYYATNQQWVEAANEGNWIEYGSNGKYPNVSNL